MRPAARHLAMGIMSSGQAINVTTPRPVVGPERFSSCRHWMVLSSAKALCKHKDCKGEGGRRLAARKLRSGGQNRRPGRSNTLKHRFCRAWPGWSGSLGPAAAHGPASSISATLLALFRECAGAAFEGQKRAAGGEAAGGGASCLLYVPVLLDWWLYRCLSCRCFPQTRPSAPLSPPKTASQGVHKQGDSAVVRPVRGDSLAVRASYLLYSLM